MLVLFQNLFLCFSLIIFRTIQNYAKHSTTGGFEVHEFFKVLGDFCGIFMLSLLIGASMGCVTALISFFKIKLRKQIMCVKLTGWATNHQIFLYPLNT